MTLRVFHVEPLIKGSEKEAPLKAKLTSIKEHSLKAVLSQKTSLEDSLSLQGTQQLPPKHSMTYLCKEPCAQKKISTQ
jgi:hypothetical protein